MRIVHSFWSQPLLKNTNNSKEDWLNLELYFMSWVLSCHSFKKHYSNIELYTDTIGKEIFINILGLPYSRCYTNLSNIEHYSPKLWALGKLHTYYLQEEPFIHVDGDTFIWGKFSENFERQGIIAQNEELNDTLYRKQFDYIFQNTNNLPKEILNLYTDEKSIVAANTGVFGGNNIRFIRDYSKLAIDFIQENMERTKLLEQSLINHFYEQYLLHAFAKVKRKEITYLFNGVSNNFEETLGFHLIPYREKFIHVVGGAKNNTLVCEQIILRLKIDFPSAYENFKKDFPLILKYFRNVKS